MSLFALKVTNAAFKASKIADRLLIDRQSYLVDCGFYATVGIVQSARAATVGRHQGD